MLVQKGRFVRPLDKDEIAYQETFEGYKIIQSVYFGAEAFVYKDDRQVGRYISLEAARDAITEASHPVYSPADKPQQAVSVAL